METPAKALFIRALDLPELERAGFLMEACGTNAELHLEVQRLLVDAARADALFGDTAGETLVSATPATLSTEGEGDRIGPYKLLQQIGEGGFGTVWMAEQDKPVRRRVALKIIKLGMDTKEVVARFEQERQALAMMDHSNIARVYDAGATALGRPFFVMELVRGVKITDFCDDQGLSNEERIGLFIEVCQAVQHAHQKGIIHRDLKPSNILVTVNDGKAVPKVIDFGVAKATQGRLTDGTLFTQFEQMIGTPLYMSPEQAEMTSLDVDTRSDIYSLGVLLYELLTGRTPIDMASMAKAGMGEIRRLIREADPPRPSQRLRTLDGNELTTAAKRRHTEAGKLPGTLRGDVDWIVMKCLEKDRQRRYDTANGLALDLQRHLKNEVITARPPTTTYLLGKLIRRNRAAFAAGAAIVVSLVIGTGVSVWHAVRATQAEQRAVAVLDELRASAPAFAEQARALASRERFGEAVEKLDYALTLRPGAPEFLLAKADLLQCQFKLADAARVYREALRADPGLVRAEASALLCEELLAAPPDASGGLTRESLGKLHVAMQRQQRPAAELIPVARLLGEARKLLVEYWLECLKDLPVSSEVPLEKRLLLRDDGRLGLDLSGTKVNDLSALSEAPLAFLNLLDCKELSDLTPIASLALVGLNLSGTGVTDLSPLREMHSLEKLFLNDTLVSDLSPLSLLKLTELAFQTCPIRDLEPIRKMPLTKIELSQTRVTDLSPLVGMAITEIDLTGTPVLDFSPLAELPLEKCFLQSNRITDLSVLRGKALTELVLWGCSEARNYEAISGIQTLELLLLPSQYRTLPDEDLAAIQSLRDHPRLRQLGSEIMNQMGYAATGSKEVFWQDWDREQGFVPGLRSRNIAFELTKLPDGNYRLWIQSQPLDDLAVIEGAPISQLILRGCRISDLTALRGLPLESLDLSYNPVVDLGPLEGMRLRSLDLSHTKINDLSRLTKLPLRELYLGGCGSLKDVGPLADMPSLVHATVPIGAKNIETLRDLQGLKMLSFQLTTGAPFLPDTTAGNFWKRWSGLSWMRDLEAKGIDFEASQAPEGSWRVIVKTPEFRDLSVFKSGDIRELVLDRTSVTDLTPLADLPLKVLSLDGTGVSDLTPLAGMSLKDLSLRETKVTDLSVLRRPLIAASLTGLWLYRTKVSDFSPVAACTQLTGFDATETSLPDLEPVRGRKLRSIYFASSGVRDISVLAGMPLEKAFFDLCAITDVEPLLDCRALKELIVPRSARNLEALKELPRLSLISFNFDPATRAPSMTADEFWKTVREEEWLGRVEAGVAEGRVEEALALLPDPVAGAPDQTLLALKLAALQVWHGKDAGHDAICQRVLAWGRDAADSATLDRVSKIICLRPVTDPGLRASALAFARRGVELGVDSPHLRWYQLALGMAEFRSGNDAAALAALNIAGGSAPASLAAPADSLAGAAGFFRVMCFLRQNKPAEARALFASLAAKMKPLPADPVNPLAHGADHDDLIVWLAHNEAKGLLGGSTE
jgi:eukaryotic-like serine/threonine-protein kinase